MAAGKQANTNLDRKYKNTHAHTRARAPHCVNCLVGNEHSHTQKQKVICSSVDVPLARLSRSLVCPARSLVRGGPRGALVHSRASSRAAAWLQHCVVARSSSAATSRRSSAKAIPSSSPKATPTLAKWRIPPSSGTSPRCANANARAPRTRASRAEKKIESRRPTTLPAGAQAVTEALKSAGVPAKLIDSSYIGNFVGELFVNQAHLGAAVIGVNNQFRFKPSMRVEGACASGGLAFVSGLRDIQAGANVVLVSGVEVQTVRCAFRCAPFFFLTSATRRDATRADGQRARRREIPGNGVAFRAPALHRRVHVPGAVCASHESLSVANSDERRARREAAADVVCLSSVIVAAPSTMCPRKISRTSLARRTTTPI